MIGTQLLQFQDRKLRFLEAETKSVAALDAARNGDNVALVEQLVAERLFYPAEMARLWKIVRQAITSGAPVDYQATGDMLKDLFTRLIELLTQIHRIAAEVSKTAGREVERRDELIDALARLREMETSILSAWPWPDEPLPEFNPGTIEQSRQEYLRGEWEDVADILERLRNGGPIDKAA